MERSNIIIRKYQAEDRDSIKNIACDTAFFGAPVEAMIDDRELFFDAFYAFFFDHETSTCWVAEQDGKVVGFLAGSVDSHRQQQWSGLHIYPAITWGILRGKYTIRRRTLRYVIDLIGQAVKGELPYTDTRRFPAHLHINVTSGLRGSGIGRRLMDAYHSQLRSLGVKGVHLHTTDQNVSACILYEKVGYRIQDARKTMKWMPLLGKVVENRCYGLDLL